MLKLMIPVAIIAAAAIAATAYAVSTSSSIDRTDCPGKIVCPLTGDLVCKDRCPVGSDTNVSTADTPSCCASGLAETDATRADCPGRIECPLTGDLVCKDRCPVRDAGSAEAVVPPACCSGND